MDEPPRSNDEYLFILNYIPTSLEGHAQNAERDMLYTKRIFKNIEKNINVATNELYKKGRRRDAIGSSAGTNPNGPIALEPVPLYRHRSWLCPLLLHLSSLSSFYFVILTQRINTTHLSIAHPPYLDTSSLFNAKKKVC